MAPDNNNNNNKTPLYGNTTFCSIVFGRKRSTFAVYQWFVLVCMWNSFPVKLCSDCSTLLNLNSQLQCNQDKDCCTCWINRRERNTCSRFELVRLYSVVILWVCVRARLHSTGGSEINYVSCWILNTLGQHQRILVQWCVCKKEEFRIWMNWMKRSCLDI